MMRTHKNIIYPFSIIAKFYSSLNIYVFSCTSYCVVRMFPVLYVITKIQRHQKNVVSSSATHRTVDYCSEKKIRNKSMAKHWAFHCNWARLIVFRIVEDKDHRMYDAIMEDMLVI